LLNCGDHIETAKKKKKIPWTVKMMALTAHHSLFPTAVNPTSPSGTCQPPQQFGRNDHH
jgi:hypothetical protein